MTIDSLNSRECHIGLIAVHGSFRHKGIASFLLNFIIQEFGDRDIYATTTATNKVMRGVLEKCGFYRSGKNTDAELVFRKNAEKKV